MWEMNSGRVQIPLGQRLFPRLICFPAVCELFTAARAGSCTKLLLSEKLIFKQRCCRDDGLPVLLPLSHSLFLLLYFLSSLPQCFASTPLSLSLPFCLLGILRMTSESPSLLKIHCQINIKAGGKSIWLCVIYCDLQHKAQHNRLNRFHSLFTHFTGVWRTQWPSALRKPMIRRDFLPTRSISLNEMERDKLSGPGKEGQ